MLPLKISTFGGLSIQRGDQVISGFISRKVDALLVYLALERREHPRELVAELLWNDLLQARAMANLRMVLSSLQSQLADYILVTRQTVMIDPHSPVWLDTIELETSLKETEGELTRSAVRILEAALDLYRGEFLAGFHLREAHGFESWMVQQAQRLSGKASEILQRLIHDSLAREPLAIGIDYARRWLTIDPLREEAHRYLMLFLAQSGQRTAALAQYETCVRLLRDELNVAPEAETTRLYAQIQAQKIPGLPAAQKPIVRIPIPATPFIERPTELHQITALLDNPDCRLVTIVGPGGIGKTRLAIQAATDRTNAFHDGVYFIPLVSVQSGDFLPREIASILRFSFQGASRPREELLQYLANRKVLLILDNFEHLVGSAQLVADILENAGGVKVLVTSREWLNLQQEWVVPVDGMGYPSGDARDLTGDAGAYGAIKLFAACARRVCPRFSVEEDLQAVIKICQLVEGMPLCIELAATWLRAIPASESMNQVDVNFLSTTARNVPERHRSMRAAFDYSWKLLSLNESLVLMRMRLLSS